MKGGFLMKKSIKVLIIVLVLFALLIGIAFVTLFVNLNKEKTAITSSEFKNTMESKGYYVSDAISQFSEYNYVTSAYLAVDSSNRYKIEFYTLSDENYATMFYNNNKAIFENSAGNASAKTDVTLKNSAKYTLSSNNKYMVVSRVANTVIFVNVDSQYKDAIQKLLKEFDY